MTMKDTYNSRPRTPDERRREKVEAAAQKEEQPPVVIDGGLIKGKKFGGEGEVSLRYTITLPADKAEAYLKEKQDGDG